MPEPELTQPYEPNAVLRALYARFFDHIQVDEAWIREVRRLSSQGAVLYVLRNLNFIDFLALDHLTKRYGLPRIRFANDLRLWVLNPMGKGWLHALLPPKNVSPALELEDAIARGGSAALFLKRPPTVLDVAAGASGGRGLREGDELVEALLEIQPRIRKSILLVPQVFVWSKQSERGFQKPLDVLFGPSEWPSPVRTAAQFLYNYKHVALRLGEPLNLAEFLAAEQSKPGGAAPTNALVRRVTYAMLRRLERERHAITGPTEKPPDRVRRELVRTPRLRQAIADLAGERPENREVLATRALDMLRELQATPTKSAQKTLEVLLSRVFQHIYAGIDYDPADMERLRAAARTSTLVLLPSHKSHIDYLVLGYIFNEQNLPLPRIAAGDNLNFFPVGDIFRQSGAFFIRRSFKGDRLYAAVVDAYIRRLLRDGSPIELFLEGGRSRTGKLLPPKLGLLNMIVEAALGLPNTKTCFVPLSIGYERLIEESSYEHELSGGEKQKEDTAGLLRSGKLLRHRYGRINVQVGEFLTLEDLQQELGVSPAAAQSPAKRRALVTRLGNRMMDEMNRVTAVTPGALAALALLTHDRQEMSHAELVDACRTLMADLRTMGARVTPTTASASGLLRSDAITEAAQLFLDGGLLEGRGPREPASGLWRRRAEQAGLHLSYRVPENKRLLLDTTKNAIVHFFVERALIALAVLADGGAATTVDTAKARVQALSRLLKYEFRFHADRPFDEIFTSTVFALTEKGVLTVADERLVPGRADDEGPRGRWLRRYASTLSGLLGGYRAAARSLEALLKGPLAEKDLVRRGLAAVQRMLSAEELQHPEAANRFVVQNALRSFADQGYVTIRDQEIELCESFRTPEAVRAIEDRIAVFLHAAPRTSPREA